MILLYKNPGETPLACITAFRKTHPQYAAKKLAYAGRLDPLAEGLLLVLEEEETKERETYEKLSKIYSFQILFGVATDTYDILGKIIQETSELPLYDRFQEKLVSLLPTLAGPQEQEFPPYSAARVKGKPLYYWARKNLLTQITIPTRSITITKLDFIKMKRISKVAVSQKIKERLQRVKGDFRQDEIFNTWDSFFVTTKLPEFYVASCRMECSSGTYVRTLSNEIGKALRTPALAWKIKREAVGPYSITAALTQPFSETP